MTETVHPSLQPTPGDRIADILRALGSSIDLVAPGWGSVFGSLIGEVIPNLREQRTAEYLTKLGQRLAALEAGFEAMSGGLGVESLALFEDGARDASRATSSERIARIGYVVANGMAHGDAQASWDGTSFA